MATRAVNSLWGAAVSGYELDDFIAETWAQRPGKVRRLSDMSPEEVAALEREYGAKVKR